MSAKGAFRSAAVKNTIGSCDEPLTLTVSGRLGRRATVVSAKGPLGQVKACARSFTEAVGALRGLVVVDVPVADYLGIAVSCGLNVGAAAIEVDARCHGDLAAIGKYFHS